jgi:hypothetical protein
MKNFTIILVLLFSVSIVNNGYAQESVPKEVLLNSLNSVNKLKLSNYKTSELIEYNKAYVDKIYTIIDSDKSEKDKKSALKILKTDTDKDLNDLLGKKHFKKYEKLMEDELKPLIKKSKLLKYIT